MTLYISYILTHFIYTVTKLISIFVCFYYFRVCKLHEYNNNNNETIRNKPDDLTLVALKFHGSIFIALIGNHERPKSRMTDSHQWSSTSMRTLLPRLLCHSWQFYGKTGVENDGGEGREEWNRNSFYNQAIFMYTTVLYNNWIPNANAYYYYYLTCFIVVFVLYFVLHYMYILHTVADMAKSNLFMYCSILYYPANSKILLCAFL